MISSYAGDRVSTRTGQEGQESQDRTATIGSPEQYSQDRTGRTGQLGPDSQNRRIRTKQDSRNMTART